MASRRTSRPRRRAPAAESPARALERLVARGRFGEAATLAKAGGGPRGGAEAGVASYTAAPTPRASGGGGPARVGPVANSGAVGGAVVVTPAFRWAQNASHLFVEVRFAHSLTAPANTDAYVESATVQARSCALDAATKHASGKRWALRLEELWDELDAAASDTAAAASAGRAVIYLGKRHVGVKWPRLVACGVKAPAHSAMWMDMQQALGLDYFPGETADDAARGVEPARATTTTTEAEADAAFEDFLDDALADDAPAAPATTTAAPKKKKKASPEERAARAAVKALKKNATKARKAVAEDVARRRKAVEADLRAANLKLREDHDARAMFVDHAPAWVPAWLPRRLLVRDGVWTLFLNVARARRDEAHKAALHAKLEVRRGVGVGLAASPPRRAPQRRGRGRRASRSSSPPSSSPPSPCSCARSTPRRGLRDGGRPRRGRGAAWDLSAGMAA
ncbi:hypothetical protein JL721_8375 [Aureococcus anophagefferens]|nr:hypothetical protein JL721_8375 [Aureococcus anophagefferens]